MKGILSACCRLKGAFEIHKHYCLGHDISVNGEKIQIKKLYDDSFRLNDPFNEISVNNINVNGKLKVDKNIDVGGQVDGVDITSLSKDVVITGSDIPISHGTDIYSIGRVGHGFVSEIIFVSCVVLTIPFIFL